MIHLFKKGKTEETMLLLHGTGGDEHDLIPLIKFIDEDASVLSARGNISENGMNRFFRRHSIGSYDVPSLILETNNLNDFIKESADTYGFNKDKVIALGFSNGANIAESLIQLHEKSLFAAILFNPVYLQPSLGFKNLNGLPVFIAASTTDPFTTKDEMLKLEHDLNAAGAKVFVYWHDAGHRLTNEALGSAKAWYFNLRAS